MEVERNFLGLKMARHGCCEARNAPRRSPDVRHKAQKSVETSSNVPYCKAVRIRDGAPKFGRAPKISLEHVLPTKMAGNDRFRKSMCDCLSLLEVPTRVISYWS